MSVTTVDLIAQWDAEAGVWWATNDELPLSTEAPTFEELVDRAAEVAPEIAELNKLISPGDELRVRVIAERSIIMAPAG